MKRTLFTVSFTTLLLGCSGLKPDTDELATYPEIRALFEKQIPASEGKKVLKKVSLDGEVEEKEVVLDSAGWSNELSFLKEIDPNQPKYVGALNEKQNGDRTELKLGEGEKGALQSLSYQKTKGKIIGIQASIHEDKDVFVYHKDITLNFENDMLSAYSINGYQKILTKDTVLFKIEGKILD